MKLTKYLAIPLAALALNATADCLEKATTQAAMNACSATDYQQADAKLNQVYQQVLASVKGNMVLTEKIRQAELAWIKYRDTQVEMFYPTSAGSPDGSSTTMCRYRLLQTLTEKRVLDLKIWLQMPTEGDVCARPKA